VLFDLDGTLVDSSGSVLRAWQLVAAELAVPIEAFQPYLHGIPAPQVFAAVTPWLSGLEIAQLTERMLAEQAADTRGVVAQPGARWALETLPRDRWAIVTSADRRLAQARIRAAELAAPGVLITTEDVMVGKPDPACYLLGAQRLNFPPRRCLVVEDAPAGVAAATAAGMPVVGVLTTYHALDGVTVQVPDLTYLRLRADGRGVHVAVQRD
jgi:sugar-phosphatase